MNTYPNRILIEFDEKEALTSCILEYDFKDQINYVIATFIENMHPENEGEFNRCKFSLAMLQAIRNGTSYEVPTIGGMTLSKSGS